jgi:hypothetical protein
MFRQLRLAYETPRILVRGVFLCENVATCVSTNGVIRQNGWEDPLEPELGGQEDPDGDMWVTFD